MVKVLITLTVYLSIGMLIAFSPLYYIKRIDDKIMSDEYDPMDAYNLLLFNMFMEVSGRLTKIAVFTAIMLFYPIIIVIALIKRARNYIRLRE